MDMYFCLKWWIRKKSPINIIDAQKAEEMHKKKEPYTVVIKNNGKTINVLEIAMNYIVVRFMDDNINSYLTYVFDVKENNRIFLEAVYYHVYNENKKIKSEIYGFKEWGYVIIEKRDLLTYEVEEGEMKVDVKRNWDMYPDFGEYDSLLKFERE